MNRIIRNVIITIVTAVMLVSFFSCGVFAADEDVVLTYPAGDGFEAVGFEVDPNLITDEKVSLMSDSECDEYVAEQCLARSEEIYVYNYRILESDFENYWYNFVMKHPEVPVKTSMEYYYSEEYIYSILPQYITDSFEEDEEIRQTLNNGIDNIIACAANCDDTFGKLLIIHDEIVKNCEYDTNYAEISHNAYAYFTTHKMVCQGYAQLLYAICERLGIEAGFCRSDAINHVWNYVCVNGKWYHLDITWDDPVVTSQPSGAVVHRDTAKHNNYLVSDKTAEIEHGKKNTWISSLGFVPDCDSFFESRHIFNLSYAFTVTYDGEKYSAPYGARTTFTSPSVYTGEIITSELVKSDSSVSQYYYCFDDIKTNVNFIVLTKSSSGGFLTMTQKNEGKKDKETLYTVTFRTKSVPKNAEVTFMYWKEGTMTPLTAKKSVIK